MKTITINNKEYKIKYTIRALFIYEQITGHSFEGKTLMDNYILFYSMLVANNQDDFLKWDEFIDALDENPSLIQNFMEVNEQATTKNNMLIDDDNTTDEKKS